MVVLLHSLCNSSAIINGKLFAAVKLIKQCIRSDMAQDKRGFQAHSPLEIPVRGWWDIIK